MTSRAKSLGAAMSAVPPTSAIGRVSRRNATCLGEHVAKAGEGPVPDLDELLGHIRDRGLHNFLQNCESDAVETAGNERLIEQRRTGRCPTGGVVPWVLRSDPGSRSALVDTEEPAVHTTVHRLCTGEVRRGDPSHRIGSGSRRCPQDPATLGVSRPHRRKSSAILEDSVHGVRRAGLGSAAADVGTPYRAGPQDRPAV